MKTKTLISNCSKAEADVAAARLLHAGIDYELVPVMLASAMGQSELTYSITVGESDFKKAQKVINDKTYDAPHNRPSLGASYSSSNSKANSSSSGWLLPWQRYCFYSIFFVGFLVLLYGIVNVALDDGESKPNSEPRSVYESSTYDNTFDKSKLTPPDFDIEVIDPSKYDNSYLPHVMNVNWGNVPFDTSILLSSGTGVMIPDTQSLSRSMITNGLPAHRPIQVDTFRHGRVPNINRNVSPMPDEKDKNLNQQVEPVSEPSTQQTPEE